MWPAMRQFIPAVDTHAHVFDRTCRLVANRRYTPDYEAPVERYIAHLDNAGIQHGVLVQPSFLGTDNGYLVAALRRHPGRFAGIAVVEPTVTDQALEELAQAGVRGIRYNLFGQDPGMVGRPEYRALTARARALGWLVELHTPGPTLPAVLDTLLDDTDRVVVHHFGRPETPDPAADAAADPALARLMAFDRDGPVWVKLSAPYRLAGLDPTPMAAALLARLGPQRLLWGSDWPWTQFETVTSFDDCVRQLYEWLGSEAALWDNFNRTSRSLYGLGP